MYVTDRSGCPALDKATEQARIPYICALYGGKLPCALCKCVQVINCCPLVINVKQRNIDVIAALFDQTQPQDMHDSANVIPLPHVIPLPCNSVTNISIGVNIFI